MKIAVMLTMATRLGLGVATMLLAASAFAQSPREQLKQMVEELRAKPADHALRERIIKLAREVMPPLAIPEEARRHFVQGNSIAQAAKDSRQQELAVRAFGEALRIAPWWPDAYYNLAIAQELAGQLDAAERTLKLYLLSGPGEKEARDVQDRIYALEGKRQLAAAERVSRFSGRWSNGTLVVSIAAQGSSCVVSNVTSHHSPITWVVEWCKLAGETMQLRVNGHQNNAPGRKFGGVCELRIGADDSRLQSRTLSAWDDYRSDVPKFSYSCSEFHKQR